MHLADVRPGLGAQHLAADIGEGGDAARTIGAKLAVVLGADLALGHVLNVAAPANPVAAQFGQARRDVDLYRGIGVGAGRVIDPHRRLPARRLKVDLAHFHTERADMDLGRTADRPGGDANFELAVDVGHMRSNAAERGFWRGDQPSLRPC